VTNSANHWANQSTMKELFHVIIGPYLKAQKQELGLPADQVCVVLLDCWSVHRSVEFREFIKTEFPYIRLLYIPACCTGKLQPLDLAVNKAIKAYVRNAAHKHLTGLYMDNREVPDYKLPTSMKFLKLHIAGWLHAAMGEVKTSTIVNGFKAAGLMRAFEPAFQARASIARLAAAVDSRSHVRNRSRGSELSTARAALAPRSCPARAVAD